MATVQAAGRVICVRWMLRRDMPDVMAVENATAASRGVKPWREEHFLRRLRERNCIGMVALRDTDCAGFMVYELHADRLHVLRFAAAPGTDAGAALYAKLLRKLDGHRREYLTAEGANGELVMLGGDVPTIRPEWLTDTVRSLTADGKPYTPILADALEDAGCDAGAFLAALRDESVGQTMFAAVADQFGE